MTFSDLPLFSRIWNSDNSEYISIESLFHKQVLQDFVRITTHPPHASCHRPLAGGQLRGLRRVLHLELGLVVGSHGSETLHDGV